MMSAQLVSIITMFMSGIAVGMIIDCTRTILHQGPLPIIRKLALFIEWFIWIFLAIATFYLLFLIKGGQWRFVDPLAQVAGIISYELFFQKIARFIGRVIVLLFIKPLYYVGHAFVTIIRKIIKLFLAFVILLTNPIIKIFKKYLLKTFKSK